MFRFSFLSLFVYSIRWCIKIYICLITVWLVPFSFIIKDELSIFLFIRVEFVCEYTFFHPYYRSILKDFKKKNFNSEMKYCERVLTSLMIFLTFSWIMIIHHNLETPKNIKESASIYVLSLLTTFVNYKRKQLLRYSFILNGGTLTVWTLTGDKKISIEV